MYMKRWNCFPLPGGNVEKFSPEPFATFEASADRPDGETIMVIGNSFTGGVFPGYGAGTCWAVCLDAPSVLRVRLEVSS